MGRKWTGSGGSFNKVQLHKKTKEDVITKQKALSSSQKEN
jgi:hypothetical protein